MIWNDHDGKEMPCLPTDLVDVVQRDGDCDTALAHEFGWTHRLNHLKRPWSGDIVKWKIRGEG
jgi:hypothetical protein